VEGDGERKAGRLFEARPRRAAVGALRAESGMQHRSPPDGRAVIRTSSLAGIAVRSYHAWVTPRPPLYLARTAKWGLSASQSKSRACRQAESGDRAAIILRSCRTKS